MVQTNKNIPSQTPQVSYIFLQNTEYNPTINIPDIEQEEFYI